jgi:hypothetical protein
VFGGNERGSMFLAVSLHNTTETAGRGSECVGDDSSWCRGSREGKGLSWPLGRGAGACIIHRGVLCSIYVCMAGT